MRVECVLRLCRPTPKSESGTRTYYENQIKIRTKGNQWGCREVAGFDFRIGFSKGGVKTPLAVLRLHLHSVFEKEAALDWPADAPLPALLLGKLHPALGGATAQRDALEEINEDDAADIAAQVSSADYQPVRRQRTWQQVAPAVGADLVGKYVLYCFDTTPTKSTAKLEWSEGVVEDVADGVSKYLDKGGKAETGGRKYGVRWVFVVFDHDGYDDSSMWLHLREGAFYNPKTAKAGAWKLSA